MGNTGWPGPEMGHGWLRCCVPSKPLTDEECTRPATNRIELAASELFSIPGLATAYHTSVIVNGEEFFFSDSGIFTDRTLASHQGTPSERYEVGYSCRTGSQLLQALNSHFRPGSYDLIRKNCNSFSDCAVFYLLRRRLERKYSALERVGQAANVDLIKKFTKGMYQPNPSAASFDIDATIVAVEKLVDGDFEATGVTADMPRSQPALARGARVTVVGLKSAEHYNGQGATICRYNPVNGRWEAQLHLTAEVKAFRAENLRPAGELVLEPGERVRIIGLMSDSGQALNGQKGEVVRYMHELSRYEIRLADDETKALKAENLASCKDPKIDADDDMVLK